MGRGQAQLVRDPNLNPKRDPRGVVEVVESKICTMVREMNPK